MCAGLFLEDARSATEVWGSCKHLQLLFEEGHGPKKQTSACFVSWDKAAGENGVAVVHERHSSVSIASRADFWLAATTTAISHALSCKLVTISLHLPTLL